MQCFSPLSGFRAAGGGFTTSAKNSPTRVPMSVPCGQCIGCRVNKREQWKLRMLHEASLHDANCFWTVTYAPENVPPHGSLRMDDVSSFIKRLRSRVAPVRFRFHAKSEYGPTTFRPHYHGLFFGFDFPDREVLRRTDAGELTYYSKLLTETWGLGHCECSDLTPRSCGYVANHNVDKLNGRLADEAYQRLDPETGEVVFLERESQRCSLRPGIGSGWIDRFECDAFPSGFLVSEGHKVSVPRAYKKRLKDRFELAGSDNAPNRLVPVDDALLMSRKSRARARTAQAIENSTPERLAVREELQHIKLKRLRRDAI